MSLTFLFVWLPLTDLIIAEEWGYRRIPLKEQLLSERKRLLFVLYRKALKIQIRDTTDTDLLLALRTPHTGMQVGHSSYRC